MTGPQRLGLRATARRLDRLANALQNIQDSRLEIHPGGQFCDELLPCERCAPLLERWQDLNAQVPAVIMASLRFCEILFHIWHTAVSAVTWPFRAIWRVVRRGGVSSP